MDNEDVIAAAQSAADQLSAIYRDVWSPLLAGIGVQLVEAGVGVKARDEMLVDFHRSFILGMMAKNI